MSISKIWSLGTFEHLDPNSEKVEVIMFSNDIAFGTSLFVFCDLNIYFQL